MTNDHSPWPEDTLESATQALRELPVPEGPSSAVLQRTLETLWQAPIPFAAKSQRSWWSMRSMGRLAVAAALLLVVLVGTWWGLGDGGRKAMAYGIMERLRQAQAVQFNAKLEMNDPVRGLQTSEAVMTIIEPSWMILKVGGRNCTIDLERQKMMVLLPEYKQAIIAEQKKLPPQTGSVNLLAEFKKMDLQDAKALGSREIEGQATNGFAVTQGDVHIRVWVSTLTQLPVYTELELSSVMLPSVKMTYHDFNWHPVIDPNPPNFNVPAGYTVQNFELDLSDITESDVLALLRNAAELNQNVFPDNLGMLSIIAGLRKSLQNQPSMSVLKPPFQVPEGVMDRIMSISRGWIYIGDAQNGTDWYYGGHDVKLNEKGRPVLWYKPAGKDVYRVIDADFTIHEAALSELPKGQTVKPDWPTTGFKN